MRELLSSNIASMGHLQKDKIRGSLKPRLALAQVGVRKKKTVQICFLANSKTFLKVLEKVL